MRKHVKERIARNLELGKREAAARCQWCRKPLAPVWTLRLSDLARFCNDDCRADDEEWTACKEARR